MRAVGPRLRRVLAVVFGLFAVLTVNGVYLGSVTALEAATGETYQNYFYQLMFLAHLVLGAVLLVLVPVFGAASWGPGLGAQSNWNAGDVRFFQVWYRDVTGGPCGNAYNLSSAGRVGFIP